MRSLQRVAQEDFRVQPILFCYHIHRRWVCWSLCDTMSRVETGEWVIIWLYSYYCIRTPNKPVLIVIIMACIFHNRGYHRSSIPHLYNRRLLRRIRCSNTLNPQAEVSCRAHVHISTSFWFLLDVSHVAGIKVNVCFVVLKSMDRVYKSVIQSFKFTGSPYSSTPSRPYSSATTTKSSQGSGEHGCWDAKLREIQGEQEQLRRKSQEIKR